MRKYLSKLLTIALGLSVFASCSDIETYDPQAQLDLEKPLIEAYVRQNYPNAVQYESTGIWYEILDQGEPDAFTYTIKDSLSQQFVVASAVLNYTGRLVSDGTIFDQTTDPTTGDNLTIQLNLSNGEPTVISAWIYAFFPRTLTIDGQQLQLGILFDNGAQPGSRFRIITPSAYAYGQYAAGSIPANSPLDFEIEVLSIE